MPLVEAALRELEDLLPGANYLVDFQLHDLPYMPNWTAEQYIKAALGSTPTITKLVETTLPDLLAEVEYWLRYDRGQYEHRGGARAVHGSSRFDELLAEVKGYLERVAARSTSLVRFWRDDPIEWQFSFLMLGTEGAKVFVGWGSD